MVATKKTGSKLTVKKQTVKDLDVKNRKARGVKGGAGGGQSKKPDAARTECCPPTFTADCPTT